MDLVNAIHRFHVLVPNFWYPVVVADALEAETADWR